MLRDEVPRERMQAPSKEARREQIDEGAGPEGLDKHVIKDKLGDQIDEVPLSECLCAHEARSERVEQDLERPEPQ